MTDIPCPIEQAAQTVPDRPALFDDGGRLSYRELRAAVVATQARLFARGLKPGDAAAVLAGNSGDYVILLWACLRSGIILMPLNTRLSVNDWRQQTAEADAALLIVDAEHTVRADEFPLPLCHLNDIIAPADAAAPAKETAEKTSENPPA